MKFVVTELSNDLENKIINNYNELNTIDKMLQYSIKLFKNYEVTVKINHGYYYRSSTGEYMKDKGDPIWMCTESKIQVSKGMILSIEGLHTTTILVNYYDNDLKYYDKPVAANANKILIDEDDIHYIAITVNNNNEIDECTIIWQNPELLMAQNNIENILEYFSITKKDPIECVFNNKLLLNKNNGTLINYDPCTNFLVSDLIDISNINYIIFSCSCLYDNAVIAFYDKDENCINIIKNHDGTPDPTTGSKYNYVNYTIEVPILATTMRFAPLAAYDYSIYSGILSNAEIIDARIDNDGNTYNTLGESIRSQFSRLNAERELVNVTTAYIPGKLMGNTTGIITDYTASVWGVTEPVECSEGEQYYIHSYMVYGNGILVCYDSENNIIDHKSYLSIENILHGNNTREYNYTYTIPHGGASFVLGLYYGTSEGVDTTDYYVKKYSDELYFEPKKQSVKNIINEIIVGNNEIIDIAHSDKIGFFGNSFMNGYTIRTHHVFDNLSMWSDYLFYNYGRSGDDVLESLARINRNEKFLGDVSVNEWGLTYGILGMYTNDGALFAANNETFYQNCKKVCEAIRAMGAIPVLTTEHVQNQMAYGAQALAEKENYEFWNWARTARAMNWFKPFMLNGHPATRTHWSWTYGLKNYIDCLPRPMKSIKIFRKRPDIDGTNLDNLKYNDIYERSEKFVEIYNGSSCLTKSTEKLFDRLNNGESYEIVKSEYQTLQAGMQISLGEYALIECITPYTKNSISSLLMNINITGVDSVYIKKITELDNPLSELRYVAFGIQEGASLLTIGNKITITGGVFNDNILGEYTISGIINNMLVTSTGSTGKTTSGTDNPTTDISGVVLKGSYDYPSADYMARYDLPLCEWQSIDINYNGSTNLIDYISNCMDYDKISILFVGSNINLKDVNFIVSGGSKKITTNNRKPKEYKYGEELLTDTLLDDNTTWQNINNYPKHVPLISAVDNTSVESMPTGVSTIRILNEGQSLKQNIITTNLGKNQYYPDKIQIRILARYFPKYIDSDTTWETSEIYEGSFDCAEMSISLDGFVKVGKALVGAWWWEYIFDIDFNNMTSTKQLNIYCDKKSLQIARAEVVLI